MQSFKKCPHLQWVGRVPIRHAHNANAVHISAFVVQHSNSARPQRCFKMSRSAKLLMIAADKVHPQGRLQFQKRRGHCKRVDLAAIKHVSGKKDDCGVQVAAPFSRSVAQKRAH